MKKLITTALLALSGVISATAQPTLTSSINPAVGDKFRIQYCDTTGINKGASGAAVTWNYSTLSITSADTSEYVACSSTPDCASFPGATLANVVYIGSSPSYNYFITNSSRFAHLGNSYSFGVSVAVNPEDFFRFPMTYGSSFRDTVLYQNSDSTGFYQYKYVDSIIYDGYGTLTLPTGTTPNVMRIHRIYVETDSFYTSSGPDVNSYRYDYYEWYKDGFHSPVLLMYYDTAMGGASQIFDVNYYKQLAGVSALQNVNAMPEFTIAPNPATENIVLTFADMAANNDITFSLSDVAGKQYQTPISIADHITNNRFTYPTDKLPAGIYFVTLRNSTASTTHKITVIK
ncbi:MAG: T9SS C-terminal target domain-containing protein [Chitinophagia bacterium]|nr:T9SS C-terminal target domain-containing protein [Chitinophagia bacterium]